MTAQHFVSLLRNVNNDVNLTNEAIKRHETDTILQAVKKN